MVVVVTGALISYLLQMAAYVALAIREPTLPRPFRAAGGIALASIAFALSLVALSAGFTVDWIIMLGVVGVLVLSMGYYVYVRRSTRYIAVGSAGHRHAQLHE